jgi:hypothetical protein
MPHLRGGGWFFARYEARCVANVLSVCLGVQRFDLKCFLGQCTDGSADRDGDQKQFQRSRFLTIDHILLAKILLWYQYAPSFIPGKQSAPAAGAHPYTLKTLVKAQAKNHLPLP